MTDIIIENIIASTNIEPIDLENLNENLEGSVINYTFDEIEDEEELVENKERTQIPLSVLWQNNNGIALVLFNDGRLVSVQATTIEDAEQSIEDYIEMLKTL